MKRDRKRGSVSIWHVIALSVVGASGRISLCEPVGPFGDNVVPGSWKEHQVPGLSSYTSKKIESYGPLQKFGSIDKLELLCHSSVGLCTRIDKNNKRLKKDLKLKDPFSLV